MKCQTCGRQFSKRHKVTDICLKCNHLKKKGRAYVPEHVYNASRIELAKQVAKESENPLLDWIEKKI